MMEPTDPTGEAARFADPEEMRAFLETAIEVIDAADDEEAELRATAEYLASAFAAMTADAPEAEDPSVVYCKHGCGRGVDRDVFPGLVKPDGTYDCRICTVEQERTRLAFEDLCREVAEGSAVAQRLLSMTPDLIPVYAGLLRGALAQVNPNALRIQEVAELFPPWMRTMIVRYEEAL